MDSLTLFPVLCGLFSLLVIFRSVHLIRRQGWISVTAFMAIMMLSRTAIGVPLQDFFVLPVQDVKFSGVAMTRSAICMLIFAIIVAIGQEIVARMSGRIRPSSEESYDSSRLFAMGVCFWLVAMAGQIYFLFVKGNISMFPTALRGFGDPEDHYSYRAYATSVLDNAGLGQSAHYLGLFIFTPIALVLLASAYLFSKNTAALLLWIVLVLATPVPIIINGQRSPLVVSGAWALLTLGFALYGHKVHAILLTRRLYLSLIAVFVIVVALGSGVYLFTNKAGILESVLMMIDRLFIVPAVTPNYIYELIPEQFNFRGFTGVFYMPNRHADVTEITYGDLSVAITGFSSNVNSHAIAVGYSGLGYLGAFLISLVLVGTAVLSDRLLVREALLIRAAAFIVTLDPLQVLTSEGFWDAVINRTYIISTLVIIFAFRLSSRRGLNARGSVLCEARGHIPSVVS
jgi:hypothetical protein